MVKSIIDLGKTLDLMLLLKASKKKRILKFLKTSVATFIKDFILVCLCLFQNLLLCLKINCPRT